MKTLLSFASFIFICTLEAQNPTSSEANNRILIVSGGGASGAWGGGLAEALSLKKEFDYRAVFGSSTGSLIIPFVQIPATTKPITSSVKTTTFSTYSSIDRTKNSSKTLTQDGKSG